MRVSLVLLGGIIVFSVAVARALSCVCSPLECDLLTDDDCPGGLTWDPCKCCKVCARVEGEPCGGLFGFSGSCADGLQCIIKNLLHHTKEVDEGICTSSDTTTLLIHTGKPNSKMQASHMSTHRWHVRQGGRFPSVASEPPE